MNFENADAGCSRPSRGTSGVWAQLPGWTTNCRGESERDSGPRSCWARRGVSGQRAGEKEGALQSAACPRDVCLSSFIWKMGTIGGHCGGDQGPSVLLPSTELARAQTLEPDGRARVPAPPLTSRVTRHKVGHLTGPRFSHLWNVDKDRFTGFL